MLGIDLQPLLLARQSEGPLGLQSLHLGATARCSWRTYFNILLQDVCLQLAPSHAGAAHDLQQQAAEDAGKLLDVSQLSPH